MVRRPRPPGRHAVSAISQQRDGRRSRVRRSRLSPIRRISSALPLYRDQVAALSTSLILLALFALVAAVIGLIKQRVVWTRIIATRRDAGLLLAASLVVMVVGGALTPTQNVASARPAPATKSLVPSSSQSPATVAQAFVAPTARPRPTLASPSPSPVTTLRVATRPSPSYSPAPAPRYVPPTRTLAAPPVSVEPTTGAYNGGGDSNTYTNVDGQQVERPDSTTAGASAKCNDGTYSHSRHRSGTCSGHGGVAEWLNP